VKITGIKQQVRRHDRYSVYGDGKYLFSLSDSELLATQLFVGQEIDAADLERLKQTAVLDKAYSRCLDLLSRRARSEWELRDYLKRKEYDAKTAQAAIDKLQKRGYVDDKKFGEAWVSNRRLLKSTSQRRLRQELQQKHIAPEVIDEVLAEDETDERQVLRNLVAKKRTQTKYQDKLKLMQYLSRQGYNYDDIKSVMAEDAI
jgi:regulatory protein